ncbi:hypothetical protein JB92DRAFT_2832415 [Gautieria morchelliformis]|nr:hypothetical protein JB92DRAFT_2832415 [Gautieria morchelliformis]
MNGDLAALVLMIVQEFPDYYDKLVNPKSVQCLEANHTLEAIRKPTAVILDLFLLPILQHTRSVTRRSIPVLAWGSPYASFTLTVMGPEKLGRFGHVEAKACTQAEVTRRKLDDSMDEVNMVLVCVALQLEQIALLLVSPIKRTPEEFRWITANNRDFYKMKCLPPRTVYAIGPLTPPGFGDIRLSILAKQMEFACSNNGDEFKIHGERYVIYAFPKAVIPPGYAENIKQSGIGLLSKWSPQQTILNHPATGWIARDTLWARGPEGERKRRNAESMRYKWKKEWEEGGEALNDLRRFLADSSSDSEKHIEYD